MRAPLALLLALAAAAPAVAAVPAVTLVGYAELPAATFVPGPTAGRWQGAGTLRGHAGPYPGRQPVQGFSGVLADAGGWFTVLGDNGFGALETSADHLLTMYRMKPSWGGPGRPGTVRVGDAIRLADPDRRIPWTITHQFEPGRPLSGADLDPESFVRMADGSYWVGDEFGPFLVHVDAKGKVLRAPIGLPDPDGGDVRSPQHPFNEESAAVRFLGAMRAHAMSRAGDAAKPIQLSPWHLLVADGDAATGAPGRTPGASEIVDVKSLHAAGFQVVPWTVNDRARMDRLLALGVDGIITDRPDLLHQALAAFDADKDGKPGDFLDADGNVDPARFDAQGHRGARDLRPESTLPAFEAALDHGMSTLETDCVIAGGDRVVMLSHEPRLAPAKTRRLDGEPMPAGDGPVVVTHTSAALQATYDRAMTLSDRPLQTLDPAASPVAVAFAAARRLPSIHAILKLDDLFAFVKAYEAYYATGPGREHPRARARTAAARRVRFNLETKTSPAERRAGLTPEPETFARHVANAVAAAGMTDRTTIQSFDFHTLFVIQREFPKLATAFLLEDALPFGMRGPGAPVTRDPFWPWRVTGASRPMRAHRSGGFESLAMAPNGRLLYPIMEKPLAGARPDRLLVPEFDARAGRYTGKRWWYPWDAGATSVADFTMVNATQGLAIERDDGEGRKALLKRLYLVTLGKPGTVLKKELVADLMRIQDPQGLAGPGQPGDVARAEPFGMPFWTIEGVVVLDPRHVLILNDNNYPYSAGRHQGTGQPDDDEWAVLRLARPLPMHRGFKPVRWR